MEYFRKLWTSLKFLTLPSLTWMAHIVKHFLTPVQALNSVSRDGNFDDITSVYMKSLDLQQVGTQTKLKIYGLFKQAKFGDNNVNSKPRSATDRVKWSAWMNLKGMSKETAQLEYVGIYNDIRRKQNEKHKAAFIKNINNSNGRLEWMNQNHRPGNLENSSFYRSFRSNVYPDQLPDHMIMDYLESTDRKFKDTAKGHLAYNCIAEKSPRPVRDSEFNYILTQTSLSKLIYSLQEIPEVSRNHYTQLFGISEMEYHFILDLTIILVLFEQTDNYTRTISIAIENLDHVDYGDPIIFPETLKNLTLLYPIDGLAWEMAKIHSVHNAYLSTSVGIHSYVHFGVINPAAVAYAQLEPLEKTSILSRIIQVHTWLSVQVNSEVVNSSKSLINDEESILYSWNVRSVEGHNVLDVYRLMEAGWKDHPIYNRGLGILTVRDDQNLGNYRKVIKNLRECVDNFVGRVVDIIGNDADEVQFWSLFMDKFLPLIPRNHALLQEDVFSFTAMKFVISDIVFYAMEHSLEHKSFELPCFGSVAHLRIRSPVPIEDKSTDMSHIYKYVGNINTMSDRSKFVITHHVAFHDHSTICCADFYFKKGGYFVKINHLEHVDELREFEKEFVKELVALFDGELCCSSFREVGVSIQS